MVRTRPGDPSGWLFGGAPHKRGVMNFHGFEMPLACVCKKDYADLFFWLMGLRKVNNNPHNKGR